MKKLYVTGLLLFLVAGLGGFNYNSVEVKSISPIITNLKWGEAKTLVNTYRDVRLWPNHEEGWDWSKTGTRHNPGVQIADLSDFIDKVDIIVLSQGVDGVLQIKPETLEYLRKLNKKIIVALTPTAVAEYNKLAKQGQLVGALIHTTC